MADADEQAVAEIVASARAVVGAGDAGATDRLRAAVTAASPDDRSVAAQQLAEDFAALDVLHQALRDAGIEQTPQG